MTIGVRVGIWVAAATLAASAFEQTTPLETGSFEALILDGHFAEATQLAQRQIDDFSRSGRTDSPEFADSLDRLALAQGGALDPEEQVRRTVDGAMALHAKLGGPESPLIGASLNALGTYQFLRADYRGALASFEKALALEDHAPGVPVMELTATLNGYGQALASLSKAKQAIGLHERALALREKAFGPSDLRTLETRNALARDYYYVDLKRSAEIFRQTLDLAGETGHADHFLAGQAAFGLANTLRDTSKCADASPLYRHALDIYGSTVGVDNIRLMAPLNNLGLCTKTLGDYATGRKLLERALAITRKAKAAANEASILANLGIILKESGDYPGARDAYEQALPELENAYGPSHTLVASNLQSLGILLLDMGDYAEARPLLERAAAIFEKSMPDNPRGIELRSRVGVAWRLLGDLTKSREILEAARTAAQKRVGAENLLASNVLVELGETMSAQGDYDGAERAFREVLRVREAVLQMQTEAIANVLLPLGEVLTARGDAEQALGYFRRGIEINSKAYGAGSQKIADLLSSEASALHQLGRNPEAAAAALHSARIARDTLALTSRTLPERQALLYERECRAGLDTAIELAPDSSPELRRQIWDALVRARSLVLDEMSRRKHAAAAPTATAWQPLVDKVEESRRELAASVIQGAPIARVNLQRQAAEASERALAQQSSAFRAELASRQVGLPEVLVAMPPHGALVSYARAADHYFVFAAASAGANPTAIDLGGAGRIDKLIADWRAQIDAERDSFGRNAALHEAAYRATGTALRRAVWDPVAAAVAGAESVYVTFDGALQTVNLAALPSGTNRYLVETAPLFQVLTAERDMVSAGATPPNPSELLAIGNPAFDASSGGRTAARIPASPTANQALQATKTAAALAESAAAFSESAAAAETAYRGDRSDCGSFAALHFPLLPGTALEAREVASIGKAAGFRTELLEGSRATVDALRTRAPGARVIHLATHGFFLDNVCRANPALIENPLMRSGIALAGANRRGGEPGAQDGLLTAEEAASLNLEGVSLVVLSGCDTGRGAIENGEGVLGLRRAFRIAGAATLVTSLWPAADNDTRQWMAEFYRAYLTHGQPAAEAVRAADRSALRARRAAGKTTHPFYWAEFIASGAPR